MELTIPTLLPALPLYRVGMSRHLLRRWEIVIDDRTLNRYRKIRGPFGKRVRASIDWKKENIPSEGQAMRVSEQRQSL